MKKSVVYEMRDELRQTRISELLRLILGLQVATEEIIDLELKLKGQSPKMLAEKHRGIVSGITALIKHHQDQLTPRP